MSRRVVFCESWEHIQQAVSDQMTADTGYDLVALTPEAAWTCQLNGEPYLKIEDFYNEADLSTHDEEVFEAAFEWARWVDEFIQHRSQFCNQSGFLPASSSIGLLYTNVFCGLFEASYALAHFIERASPSEICYWPWEPVAPPLHLKHKTPPYCALLPNVAPQYGVLLKKMRHDDDAGSTMLILRPGKNVNTQQSGANGPRLIDRIQQMAYQRLKKGWMARELGLLRNAGPVVYLRSFSKSLTASQRVLIAGTGYDLDPVVLALRQKGIGTTWLHAMGLTGAPPARAKAMQQGLSRLWPILAQEQEFWAPLTKWGIGRNERAEAILSFWWHRLVPELWEGHQSALQTMSEQPPLAVLALEAGSTLCSSVLQAAKTRSIPHLIYQHGSTARIGVCNWQPYLSQSDCLLVYGQGTADHLHRNQLPGKPTRGQVIPVGSARLDVLRLRANSHAVRGLKAELHEHDHRPIVLYVPTVMGAWGKALGDLAGYPDVSYFELQERVIRLFANFPHVRLFYRDYPNYTVWNPIPDLIQREIPNGRAVLSPALTNLIWAVDAIIVDHMITALGEALLTSKRLVVYSPTLAGNTREAPQAKVLLRKRATVAEVPDEFVDVVHTLLAAGDFDDVATPNDEFLKAYCTHLNDGGSAQRAVNEVLREAHHLVA